MKTTLSFLLSAILTAFIVTAFIVTAAAQEAAKATPDALVTDLYKVHDAEKSPFFQDKDRALVNRYFAKDLADLMWKDVQVSKGEVGAIDFDPLYNAQDFEIKKFAINKAQIEDSKASVLVTFMNFDKKQRITFRLVRQNGAWRISDIDYGKGTTLLMLLKQAAGN